MHSRSTASATGRNSRSASPSSPSAACFFFGVGKISFSSASSRLSSTWSKAAAICKKSASSSESSPLKSTCRRLVSFMTSARRSPSPSTPSVSLIFLSSSACGINSCKDPMPVRTKISSTSFTLPRSSLIAAATVFISFTLGADSPSRACSISSSPGKTSSSLKARWIAATRLPLLVDRPM
ncbi:hypothetical protein MnTg04_00977 [bacterium MnTg04]|nr:hypothetical protein MnTg04_00977 [bacterium MnTg04]